MTAAIIQISSISKHFGSAHVLDELDWQVAPGQVIGLLGRNGAGKSTLLECMLGLRETDAGAVTICGDGVDRLSDPTRARIGYVPQRLANLKGTAKTLAVQHAHQKVSASCARPISHGLSISRMAVQFITEENTNGNRRVSAN